MVSCLWVRWEVCTGSAKSASDAENLALQGSLCSTRGTSGWSWQPARWNGMPASPGRLSRCTRAGGKRWASRPRFQSAMTSSISRPWRARTLRCCVTGRVTNSIVYCFECCFFVFKGILIKLKDFPWLELVAKPVEVWGQLLQLIERDCHHVNQVGWGQSLCGDLGCKFLTHLPTNFGCFRPDVQGLVKMGLEMKEHVNEGFGRGVFGEHSFVAFG